jgi:transposase InsO family protein
VATRAGWRSLAVLLDAAARRGGGWAMADHLRTALALAARAPALRARRPAPGLVRHTARGGQYTAAAHRAQLTSAGLVCSMSRRGDCLDNALAERFFATRKAALGDRHAWATRAAARTAIFEWLAVFDTRQRAHSAPASQPPAACAEVVVVQHSSAKR